MPTNSQNFCYDILLAVAEGVERSHDKFSGDNLSPFNEGYMQGTLAVATSLRITAELVAAATPSELEDWVDSARRERDKSDNEDKNGSEQ